MKTSSDIPQQAAAKTVAEASSETEASAETVAEAGTPATVPAPEPTVWPSFQARNAVAMIDFLTSVFGFRRTVVYMDSGTVAHAQLNWPEGGGIMLGSHKPDAQWNREPGTAGIYVVTDNMDELYRRVSESSAAVIRPLQDTGYGSREFTCADPEGNLWSFGTYRGEPAGGAAGD